MRNMVGLATPEFSGSARVMQLLSGVEDMESEQGRRYTRYATLDGGCDTYDGGYSASDREINITVAVVHKSLILDLLKNWSSVYLSTRDGFYYATPRRFRLSDGGVSLQLYITEQLS